MILCSMCCTNILLKGRKFYPYKQYGYDCEAGGNQMKPLGWNRKHIREGSILIFHNEFIRLKMYLAAESRFCHKTSPILLRLEYPNFLKIYVHISFSHMYRIYNEEMCARSISKKKKVFSIPTTIAFEKFTLMTEILIHKARFYMLMADEREWKRLMHEYLWIFFAYLIPSLLFIKQKLLTIFFIIRNSANFQSRTHSTLRFGRRTCSIWMNKIVYCTAVHIKNSHFY